MSRSRIVCAMVLSICLIAAPQVGAAQDFEHTAFDAVLRAHVTVRGVDYARLKADRAGLDGYVAQLGAVSSAQFDGWNRAGRLAYLINAYNALVLQSVLDAYPIQRSLNPAALVRPANSVWQIGGFFNQATHRVAGRSITLDQLEHELIRPIFKEPRVHAALVCAARSCPPLRNEAYDAARLETQLDEQARRFLSDRRLNRFERDDAVVALSEIFKWFGDDFGGGKGVISFVGRYVDTETQNWLKSGKYRVTYIDYDWNLNDASTR